MDQLSSESASAIAANQQNALIMNGSEKADVTAHRLMRVGFTVLSIEIGGRRPIVWVQHCAACDTLEGGMMVRHTTAAGTESVMAAPLGGCQVQWRVQG